MGYMTQVSRDTILRLAALSNLQLADEEIDGLTADLGRILAYVEQLDELDTKDVEPAYQVTGLHNVYRQDVVDTGDISRETLLALAPSVKDSQIKVPKVI
jgi:aspartyl-tRNA(Asn)/glutamyl-tRNA(Gln) amidotransferase subunit C